MPTAPASPTPPPPDLTREMRRSISALEQRLARIESALASLQSTPGVRYLGLCVNQQMHPDRNHPHWDGL